MSNYRHEETKYSAISAAIVLVTAFVLVQPAMQVSYALVTEEGIPSFDTCTVSTDNEPEDPISQNTITKNNLRLVKTVHAEKEIFDCFLDQGNLPVIVDVTTYIELYQNITTQEVESTNVIVTTCVKEEESADIFGCEAYTPDNDNIPVSSCDEESAITHPQEMDTVNRQNNALTVESQKEVFLCDFGTGAVLKKVDLVLFTSVYENLSTQTIQDVQTFVMRCTVLVTDNDPDNDRRDATVESCQFTDVPIDILFP